MQACLQSGDEPVRKNGAAHHKLGFADDDK